MDEKHGVKDVENNSNEIISDEDIKMADLLGPEVKVEEGRVIKAQVIARNSEGILVDLGMKSEGLIPTSEVQAGVPDVQPGDYINVIVVKLYTQSGHPIVSHRQVRERESWDRLAVAQKDAAAVEGTIKKKIKGGFQVDVDGVNAFLPASQLEIKFVKDTDRYIGQTYQFLVTDLNRGQKNVVLSRRKLLEIERNAKKGEIMATLQEGQVIEGTVTSITSFGAFVDIGGIEGLLHIGDITWYHLDKVSDVLKAGQTVKVKVLRIDREKDKISLGMKQITPRPWETAPAKFPAGSTQKGKITSITDFGLFVELEPGLEGLLHISEVSWVESKENLRNKFSVGQELEVKVLSIDPVKEKLSLSLKRIQENPWDEIQRKYPKGSKAKGVITNLTPFGAFVRLPEGIEGLLHVGDLSWTKKVRHPQEVLQTGQEIEVVVLDVNPATEKISLSLKHLNDDPFKKYRSGNVVTGTVKRIEDFGAFVELEPGVEALLRLPEISQDRIGSPAEVLKLDQTVEAKIIKSDPHERKIDLSIRKLEHERERELLKKYVNKDERPTLGQVLQEEEE